MGTEQDLTELATRINADPFHLAKPGIVEKIKWEKDKGLDHAVYADPNKRHTPVCFTVVAEVSHTKFWAKADGGYRLDRKAQGNSNSNGPEPVQKAKANFLLDPPRHRAFESDTTWAAIKATLDRLMHAKRTGGAALKHSTYEGDSLRIRHHLFEERAVRDGDEGQASKATLTSEEAEVDASIGGRGSADEDEEDGITDADKLPEGLKGDALGAIVELLAQGKYKYMPIPAFDRDGTELGVDKLETLKGCLAEADFTVSHQYINGQGDLFFLELVSIRKLRNEGYVGMCSPRKKYNSDRANKRKAADELDGSPRKKGHGE